VGAVAGMRSLGKGVHLSVCTLMSGRSRCTAVAQPLQPTNHSRCLGVGEDVRLTCKSNSDHRKRETDLLFLSVSLSHHSGTHRDKELRGVAVLATVGHRNDASSRMLELEPLLVVVELLGPNRLSSAAVASSEVAALRYESSLDSMESTRDRTFREGAKGHVKEKTIGE